MTDIPLDYADIERMLDQPQVVIKSSRGKTFVYLLGTGLLALLMWALMARNAHLKDGFFFWLAWGLFLFFLLGALVFARLVIRPVQLEISETGIVYAAVFRRRHYSWDSLGRIYFRKGYFTGRTYIPDRIMLEGRTTDIRTYCLSGIWVISLADLLALLKAAQNRWGGAGLSEKGN